MEFSFHSRLKHAWNAFFNKDPTGFYKNVGMGYSYRPDVSQEGMNDPL